MALAVTIQNGGLKVKVTGLDLSLLTKGQWRRLLLDMGEDLQERISESFSNERVGGSSSLGKNTKGWNQYKATHGLDSRKGHASGKLQGALDGKALFVVSAVRNGEATIRFLEPRLFGRVPYAEYYEENKVKRAGILVVAKSWAVTALKPLKSKLASATMKAKRAASRTRKRAVDKRRRA